MTELEAPRREWMSFRHVHWLHAQGVAVSPPLRGGCRAVIVAEPPPDIGVTDLRLVAPGVLSQGEIHTHKIGYDGWTKDVLFVLAPLSEEQNESVIAALHIALFGTSHKARPLTYTERRSVPLGESLDVQLSGEELDESILEGDARFVSVYGQERWSGPQLIHEATPKVYTAKRERLVAWVLPNHADIREHRQDGRQFLVDSDLILGAIKGQKNIVLVGRQRTIDPELLPPLRMETLNLLAAVGEDELYQSFEHELPMSGRYSNGWDWTPAYLSPALMDTEYGSVLNIADQILKIWSENGTVEHENFGAYPHPSEWIFRLPASDLVKPSQWLRYTFTSTDFGTELEADDHRTMSFASTATLRAVYAADVGVPVTQKLSEIGTEFFARAGDPYLVRVAQYTAFYQIARNLGLRATWPVRREWDDAAMMFLESQFSALLATWQAGGDKLKKSLEPVFRQWLKVELAKDPRFRNQPPSDSEWYAIVVKGSELLTRNAIEKLHPVTMKIAGATPELLRLGFPRRHHRSRAKANRRTVQLLNDFSRNKVDLLQIVDGDALARQFGRLTSDAHARWIHTPSASRSRSLETRSDNIIQVGGHHISAGVRVIKAPKQFRRPP